MKGLYQVTAMRAKKVISEEVYGNIAERYAI